MPEINQYTLSHKELIELILNENGIKEGRWSLLVNLAVGMGMFGPAPDQVNPGAVVTVNKIGIQRVVPGSPESQGAIIVDASTLNPKPSAKPKQTKAAQKKRA